MSGVGDPASNFAKMQGDAISNMANQTTEEAEKDNEASKTDDKNRQIVNHDVIKGYSGRDTHSSLNRNINKQLSNTQPQNTQSEAEEKKT